MGLFSTLFGGKDKSAQRHTLAQNQRATETINRNADRARQDVLRLFPAAQHTMQQGVQQALDLYGQSIPQQMSAFQQGNVGAQEAQLIGLGAIQKALMGVPMDLSDPGMANYVQSINVDPNFARQNAPSAPLANTLGLPETIPQDATDADREQLNRLLRKFGISGINV